jgi:hypothetical protein
MIRTTVLSLVVATVVAVVAAGSAQAAPIPSVAAHTHSSLGWGIGVSIGGGGHRVHPHYATHVTYVQEPVYQTVLVGYDGWGRPVYNTVLAGYRTVPVHTPVVYPHVHRRPSWQIGFGYRHR